MTGGPGADEFVYVSAAHSTVASQDHILDFGTGADLIDLSAIDANNVVGNNAFTFIGSAPFDSNAGELRAYQNAGTWYVEGDINGDGVADLSIAVTSNHALTAGDFVL